MEKIHILPINDLKEHIENVNCHCNPKTEYKNDRLLIIHNCYDGRDIQEKSQRLNIENIKKLYSKNKINVSEIEEIFEEALDDEEYESANNIKKFLNTII